MLDNNMSSGGNGNLSQFDIGISKTGVENIKESLRIEVYDKYLDALHGELYHDMIAVLQEAWQGEDADNFFASIDETIDDLTIDMKAGYDRACRVLDKICERWETFRKSNIV